MLQEVTGIIKTVAVLLALAASLFLAGCRPLRPTPPASPGVAGDWVSILGGNHVNLTAQQKKKRTSHLTLNRDGTGILTLGNPALKQFPIFWYGSGNNLVVTYAQRKDLRDAFFSQDKHIVVLSADRKTLTFGWPDGTSDIYRRAAKP